MSRKRFSPNGQVALRFGRKSLVSFALR